MAKSTLAEILDRILDKGITQNDEEGELCCPDCNQDGLNVYVIASVETFLKFMEAIPVNSQNSDCCLNSISSVETNLKLVEAFGTSYLGKNCPTNFDDCWNTINQSLSAEGSDRILDKGIVEFGSIKGVSKLCDIYNFCVSSATLNNDSTVVEVFDRVMDKGIVISCDEDRNFVTASVETWITYWEAVGGTPVVPAINLLSTVDTIIQSGNTI